MEQFQFIRKDGEGNLKVTVNASQDLLRQFAVERVHSVLYGITGLDEGTEILTDEKWDIFKKGLEAFGFSDVTLERNYKGLQVTSK